MTINEIDKSKKELTKKANKLVTLKKELYSDMDIESPMSKHEKNLNAEIAVAFSEINELLKLKRKLKAQANKGGNNETNQNTINKNQTTKNKKKRVDA